MTQERLAWIEKLVKGTRIFRDDPNGIFNVMKELVEEVKFLTQILDDAPHNPNCAYIISLKHHLWSPNIVIKECSCFKAKLPKT